MRLRERSLWIGDDDSTMTDLLSRLDSPSLRPRSEGSPPPEWLAGAVAGVAMAGAGALACMGLAVVAWLSGDGGSVTDALRAGAGAWLLAHGSGLTVAGAHLTAAPLGLTLAVCALAWFAGRWAVRVSCGNDPTAVTRTGAAVGVGYTVCVGGVAAVTPAPGIAVSLTRALVLGLLLSSFCAMLGAARASGVDRFVLDRLPEEARAAIHGAAGGVAALVAAAAVGLSLSLVTHVESLQRMVAALNLGLLDVLLLMAACLLVLPNAVLLTISVLLGPGFALGTGTSVTATSVSLGAVPAVPWFAAVPSAGSHPMGLAAVVAVPSICGAVAGILAVRHRPVASYSRACLRGGLGGASAGLAMVVLIAASAGSIGPGRMADVGPDVLSCLVVAVPVMGVAGILAAVSARLVARA